MPDPRAAESRSISASISLPISISTSSGGRPEYFSVCSFILLTRSLRSCKTASRCPSLAFDIDIECEYAPDSTLLQLRACEWACLVEGAEANADAVPEPEVEVKGETEAEEEEEDEGVPENEKRAEPRGGNGPGGG